MAVGTMSANALYFLKPLRLLRGLLPLLLGFVSVYVAVPVAASKVGYIYDELGRLRAAVDLASDTAVYNYDSVGNLLTISRQISSDVSVIEFISKSGPEGAEVTIFGTGFSPNPADNVVTFNGVQAAVISATATSLVVMVPPGASTGQISVTNSSGRASSDETFVVAAEGAPPAISGFTPTIGPVGTAVIVSGTHFALGPLDNKVAFGQKLASVNSSSATSIATRVPPTGLPAGKISVTTLSGTAVSAQDFFVVPEGYDLAAVESTGRLEIDGPSLSVALPTAGNFFLGVFDGTAGQYVTLGGTNNTFTYGDLAVKVYNPDGSVLADDGLLSSSFGVYTELPSTGTYTILAVGSSGATGSLTLTLSEALTGTIVMDGPSEDVILDRPGQRMRMTFDGTAGQYVTVAGTDGTFPYGYLGVGVYNPDGSVLASGGLVGSSFGLYVRLPETGTYLMEAGGLDGHSGSLTFWLSEALTGTIVMDGPSEDVMLRPGQRTRMTFDGTAGQYVTVAGTDGTFPYGYLGVGVYNPDGSVLASGGLVGSSFGLYVRLPETGTYLMEAGGLDGLGGSLTFWLSEALTGTIVMDGPSEDVMLRPGQKLHMSFEGIAGQDVNLAGTNGTFGYGNSWVTVYDPSGNSFGSGGLFGSSFSMDMNLPETGTYLIHFGGNDGLAGSITLTLTSQAP